MQSRFALIFRAILLAAISLAAFLALLQSGQAGPQAAWNQQAGEIVTPTLVTIDAPLTITVGVSATFTANVEPISTTLPVTYSWQASTGQAITHTGGLSDTLALAWEQPGQVLITITAANTAGLVTGTHTIQVAEPPIHRSYVPFTSHYRSILRSFDWEWQNPLPQGNTLNDVWVSDDGQAYAVGDYGTILYHDGQAWLRMKSGTSGNLTGIWGSASNDVYAVGRNASWHGIILHYDGHTWDRMDNFLGDIGGIYDIWGYASNDIFAVGYPGVIIHYDGNTWSQMESGTGFELYAVWGSRNNDVFAVGGDFYIQYMEPKQSLWTIRHYDGNTWSQIAGGKDFILHDIWGNASNDIFAVGSSGVIMHYDGSIWSKIEVDKGTNFYSVWGTASNDVFAAGDNSIWHYDGNTWSKVESNAGAYSIYGNNNKNIFAVSDINILHYNGSSWSREGSRITVYGLTDIWGNASDDIFAVGGYNRKSDYPDPQPGPCRIILHYDGNNWSQMDSSANYDGLEAIWGNANNDVFAVGHGVILHYDGNSWKPMNSWDDIEVTSLTFQAIWGNSHDNVFAIGYRYTDDYILTVDNYALHYNGNTWTPTEIITGPILVDIWGSASDNAFAVGEYGTIMHYNGKTWSQMDSEVDENFSALWGSSQTDVFAISDSSIVHYDGTSWSQMAIPINVDGLVDIWGINNDDVFAVSQNGMILHFDGKTWSRIANGYGGREFTASWGSANNDIFAVGSKGIIMHYNGSPADH